MATRPTRARTPEELMRQFDDRIRALEHRTFVVVGTPPSAFLLQVDDDGRLTATQTSTGTVTVVALP